MESCNGGDTLGIKTMFDAFILKHISFATVWCSRLDFGSDLTCLWLG